MSLVVCALLDVLVLLKRVRRRVADEVVFSLLLYIYINITPHLYDRI
jgi:hypothetical protein